MVLLVASIVVVRMLVGVAVHAVVMFVLVGMSVVAVVVFMVVRVTIFAVRDVETGPLLGGGPRSKKALYVNACIERGLSGGCGLPARRGLLSPR